MTTNDIDQLIADIDDRDSEISMLRHDLDFQTKAAWANRSEINRLNALVNELSAALTETREQLTAANHRADGLQADLNSATRGLNAYTQQVAELQRALDGERKAHAKTRDYIEAVAR